MTDTCSLKALTLKDLSMVLAWRNHPVVRSRMLAQHEISLQEHSSWFERVQNDPTRHQFIVLNGTDPFGFVQFNPVNPGGIADWGFYTRPDAPKGSGKKLGQAALNHAFTNLGLHQVCGQALINNAASIAFHQRLGFTQEARLREHQCADGSCHTLMRFGLLAHDWQNHQSSSKASHAPN
ncbi:UDP-4-amino-4,6-dideoxy-N-acetyl-beta-L-altrosamine N-acetyltransferase [Limnohabitans sp.]|jgi:UDP-4-amino-4,6-dideoxy-N-acetyl-beta-L-altrosamine N-acetyltransferase|uniref:UDP-4-amino-4, 6-dideoxy-N-acetyl-beta-L-altrosamine N-acetyltransferase n=1 Tax=Limnohabitans sp. TaxID=1907725 RepID=UPI0037C049D4